MTKATVAGIWMFCAAIVFVSACAARTDDVPGSGAVSRDRITASELSEVDAENAYIAVQQLRPIWLRTRGATSFTEPRGRTPMVYVDNMRFGEIASLSTIPLAEIAEIRYINSGDATTRWGSGVVRGVIEVIRKKGRKG